MATSSGNVGGQAVAAAPTTGAAQGEEDDGSMPFQG
jgi:hypothetical protein